MSAQPILIALRQQVDGYRALARLAEAQRRHVQSGQTEALLEVLQRRQTVLDQILAAEQVLGPAKRDWKGFAASLQAEDRTVVEQLLGETRQLLEQITASDRDDVLSLQQRRITLGRKIDRHAAAKAVNRNYAAAAYGPRKSTVDLSQ